MQEQSDHNRNADAAILTGLPDWSKSIDPSRHVDYVGLKTAALKFRALSTERRKAAIEAFTAEYCSRDFNLNRASALYLFLRLLFDLPPDATREKVKVFGGWLHPSTGVEGPFDLSWPVQFDVKKGTIAIARFQGYAGRPYRAVDEYMYFVGNYPLRDEDSIQHASIE